MRVRSSERSLLAILVGLVAAGLLAVGVSVAAPAGAAAPLGLSKAHRFTRKGSS